MSLNLTPEETQLLLDALEAHLGAQGMLDALDAYPGEWSEVLDSLAGKLHAILGTDPDLDPG